MKHYLFYCFLAVAGLLMAGCSSETSSEGTPYNPSQPIKLTDFYPDSGRYQQKVILSGSNFGTDPSAIKVYFNHKQASVIGTSGDNLYVNAPRLPGDTCVLSVVIGKDSASYTKTFRYFKTVTVSTIAGNGTVDKPITAGPLAETILAPRYVCVDKDGNVFITCWGPDQANFDGFGVCRIDETAGTMDIVFQPSGHDMLPNVPCADPVTGVISFPTQFTPGSFVTLNPQEYWAPRLRDVTWPSGYQVPEKGWKHSMVVNPDDGCVYTRFYYGDVVKINPETFEVTPICKTSSGDSFGLTFNPKIPNRLFISMYDNGGSFAHSICYIDVNDEKPAMKLWSSQNTSGGYRDGKIENAQFNRPCQIFCDNDGNMYIADEGNHCIRRISPEGMTETVLGIPGVSGWKDGNKEDALFNSPRGIGISQDGTVYVADWGNGRVRKMTIN